MPIQTRDDLVQVKKELDEVVTEYLRLKKFEQQMLVQLPIKAGDRVQLTEAVMEINYEKAYGWKGHQEILDFGNVGIVHNVQWNQYSNNEQGAWQVGWRPLIDWSTSLIGDRWHCWIEPEGRQHLFYLSLRYVTKANSDSMPYLPPRGCDKYELQGTHENGYRRTELSYEEVLEMFGGNRSACQ